MHVVPGRKYSMYFPRAALRRGLVQSCVSACHLKVSGHRETEFFMDQLCSEPRVKGDGAGREAPKTPGTD